MTPSPHTAAYKEARASVLHILERFTEGEIGVLIAARQLVALRFALVGDKLDNDWRTFVGIESETDHLPTGEERKHWSAEALVVKDAEIIKAENLYREHALAAARTLIQRYKKDRPT